MVIENRCVLLKLEILAFWVTYQPFGELGTVSSLLKF